MRLEHLDRRVLGAIRCVEASSGLPVLDPLFVSAPGVHFVRNRSGSYVIFRAPALAAYEQAFEQPPTPSDPGSVPLGTVSITLTVVDPARRFVPRQATVALPRDPDPAQADEEDSLFRAIDVPLYPTPAGLTAPGWAVIRATISAPGTDEPLPGALIRVTQTTDSATEVLARGISDWHGRTRGEAMVTVPGIPVTTWSDGNGSAGGDEDEVIVSEINVTVEAVFDPAFDPEAGDIPNPDDLETRRDELPSVSTNIQLASGQSLALRLSVPLP